MCSLSLPFDTIVSRNDIGDAIVVGFMNEIRWAYAIQFVSLEMSHNRIFRTTRHLFAFQCIRSSIWLGDERSYVSYV